MSLSSCPPTVFVLLLLGGPLAQAAPATTEAPGRPPVAPMAESGLPGDGPPSAETPGPSNTIDLLIDMQQRNAGVQFNARSGRLAADAATRPQAQPALTQAPPPLAMPSALPSSSPARDSVPPREPAPSGLFGSGITPEVQTARATRVDAAATGATPDVAPPQRSAMAPQGDPLPAWLLLPRDIIQYVRDNRGFVLGSTAVGLLFVWGVSLLFSRAASRQTRRPPADTGAAVGFSTDRWARSARQKHPHQPRSHRRRR